MPVAPIMLALAAHPSQPAPLAAPVLLLRIWGPLLAALAASFAVDLLCAHKGLLPPGFRLAWRRGTAFTLLAAVLWVAVFRPLGELGLDLAVDPSKITTPQLFLLHGLLVLAILAWFALGYAGLRPRPAPAGAYSPSPSLPALDTRPALTAVGSPAVLSAGEPRPALPALEPPRPAPAPPLSFGRQLALQLGFRAPSVGREIGIGLAFGVGSWAVVVAALVAIALVVWALHGENALPKEPPALVPWIAALPLGVRLMVSLSAGFVEETFFRGFLQPRIGIALSTAMFALAHLSYGQPFMLIGITLLSLIYALLVRWRQTVWPAIAAHALFDGVQLLVIIPIALRMLGRSAAGEAAGKAVGLLVVQLLGG